MKTRYKFLRVVQTTQMRDENVLGLNPKVLGLKIYHTQDTCFIIILIR